MTALARLLAFAALLLIGLADLAQAEKRVALVIGNSDYRNTTQLRNPRNDAAGLSAALKRLNFEVLEGLDLDDRAFRKLARDFAIKIEDADVALFFYAGHGLQVNNRNYMVPVDAALKREIDLDFEAVPVELVLSHMERGDRTNIVLLDACRNNPLAANLARNMGTRAVAVGRGLARVDTGVGTYVGFATQPGNVALDGDGENSPFATALLKHIEKPGIDIETLMRQVREEVIVATAGKQVPWGNSSLVGRGFYFNPAQPVETVKRDTAPVVAPPLSTVTDQANIEIAFWNSIRDSDDPSLFKAYLTEYPTGRFATLARLRMERLATVDPKPEAPALLRTETAPEPKPDALEDGFWLAAKTSGDVALLRRYLELYPNGVNAAEARALIDEVERKQSALPPVEPAPTPRDTPTVRPEEPEEVPEAAPEEPEPAPAVVPARKEPAKKAKQPARKQPVQKKQQPVQKKKPPVKAAAKPPAKKVAAKPRVQAAAPAPAPQPSTAGRTNSSTIVGPGSSAKQGGF